MKFDLVEINKLSPPGLWNLGALTAFIDTLLSVVEAGIGGSCAVLIYTRMVVRHSRELCTKTRQNLNIRIKAWVMQCPERIALVRGIIGEAAIKRWRKNRLAEYALTKYFGDWKRKFPDGFGSGSENPNQKLTRKPVLPKLLPTYNWKPFALTKIFNVERFLYGQSLPNPEMDALQAAYLKLWGVDIMDTDYLYSAGEKGAQPRNRRTFKPVEFTPSDLVPEVAENMSGDVPEGKEKLAGKSVGKSGEIIMISLPEPGQERSQPRTIHDGDTEKPP